VLTDVVVTARPGRGGRTTLPVLHGVGSLAVRQTGPEVVHLVATAAGPLGGDTVRVRVEVATGARLKLHSVAASLALPGRDGGTSQVELHLDVAEGAELQVGLEPLIVAVGADVRVTTTLDVAAGGLLELTEQVVLGRWREEPGRWTGNTRADLAGRPWLRQAVGIGPASPAWDALQAPRALLSRLRSPACAGPTVVDATSGSAVRGALAGGGCLDTAVGTDLGIARAYLDRLDRLDRASDGAAADRHRPAAPGAAVALA